MTTLFDFLNPHRCPTGVKVSDAALSRRDEKVARLYEQGASKQRIARYLVRWLGWAVLAGTSTLGHAISHIGISCSASGGVATITDYFSVAHGMGSGTSPSRDYPSGKCWIYIGGEPQIITITPAPSGGAATCSPLSPEYGDSTTCTANPDVGYAAGTWSGDCGTGSAATPCTLTNVISAKTVSATFTAIPGYVPTGPVSGIALDPTSSTTLYAGLDGGGVWKKIGAGAWTAATTQPANLKVKALAIKTDGSILYAGTDGGGVFKSTDSGVNWAACATQPANLNLLSLTMDAAGKLYAGSEAGVFVSTDGCASWTAMNTGLPL